MAELLPDIHELFCYYNSLYFEGALGTCIVSWVPQTTSVASCDCTQAGLCEIRLSEPLLKSRSSSDLKNTLLHEMIHAFLWIRKENCNHGDHGPSFLALATSINSSLEIDDQRPSEGYNITTQHGFQNEVDTKGTHLWMCKSYGDLIKQPSKEPSPSDHIESQSHDRNCGNLLCEWHRHEDICSGWYEKVDNISGSERKPKSLEVSQANHEDRLIGLSSSTRQAGKKLPQQEEVKDKRVTKRPKIMAEFLLGDAAKKLGKKASRGDSSIAKHLIDMDLISSSLAAGPKIPKKPRISHKQKSYMSSPGDNCRKRGREISLVIQLFGVYTDEESEDDPEPLVNKRSERRKRMKLNNAVGNDDSNEQNISTPFQVISLD